MSGVALDLDRPPHLALDQHAAGKAVDGNRRGEEQRLARNDRLGRLHVGHDRFGRLVSTAADAAQGQRRRHEPEKIAAAGLVEHFDRRVGKLEPEISAARRDAGQLFQAPPEDGRRSKGPAASHPDRTDRVDQDCAGSGCCVIGGTPNSWSIDRLRFVVASRAHALSGAGLASREPGPCGRRRSCLEDGAPGCR